VSQPSSSKYDKSAILSQEEIDTLHNIQDQLKPGKKLRDSIRNPKLIDDYIDDLQKIYEHLENSGTETLPSNLPLSVVDTFETSIETIYTNIKDAIKLLNLAAENVEEIGRIQRDGQVAEKDPTDINTNKSKFFDNLDQCRQLLIEAEKVVIQLKDADAVPKNPTANAG
jgi:hypothetical protein